MATLALPMRVPPFGRKGRNLLNGDAGPRPEGPEGSTLVGKLEAVWRHFTEPAQVQAVLAELDEEVEYRPMSPKRSFHMTVNLQVRGRGKPPPYQLDDDALG